MSEHNYLTDQSLPEILRNFLTYTQTVQEKSKKTTIEYALDLRLFLRYLKKMKSDLSCDINDVDISDIDIFFIKSITSSDTYDFIAYLATERAVQQNSTHSKVGLSAISRSRKVSAIRSFFKYMVDKIHILTENPISVIELPAKSKKLPKYLDIDESTELLQAVDGTFKERDLCILLIFLSCGLRVSELVGINVNDIRGNALRVRGKGDKERMVFLNEICLETIENYLEVRLKPHEKDKNALFISRQGNRINVQTVKWLVKKYSYAINRDDISAHKLRHTAATLMYSNGLDIRTLQEVLGHSNLETTMIYTHISDANLQSAATINPISRVNLQKKEKEED